MDPHMFPIHVHAAGPINPTVNFWKLEIELQTACFVSDDVW